MIANEEFKNLSKLLEYNLSTRTTLITFAYTTVVAILAIAIGIDDPSTINAHIFLMPYCLLIPINARIVYYRIIHAHITAFLMTFYPSEMKFNHGAKDVPEKKDKFFTVISVLNNIEIPILSIICAIIFYYKYFQQTIYFDTINVIICFLPIVFVILIIAITVYGYNYSKHQHDYLSKWEKYKCESNKNDK